MRLHPSRAALAFCLLIAGCGGANATLVRVTHTSLETIQIGTDTAWDLALDRREAAHADLLDEFEAQPLAERDRAQNEARIAELRADWAVKLAPFDAIRLVHAEAVALFDQWQDDGDVALAYFLGRVQHLRLLYHELRGLLQGDD